MATLAAACCLALAALVRREALLSSRAQ